MARGLVTLPRGQPASSKRPRRPHLCRGAKERPLPPAGRRRVKGKARGGRGPALPAPGAGPTQLLSPAWPGPGQRGLRPASQDGPCPCRTPWVSGGRTEEGARQDRERPVNHHPVASPQRRGPSSGRKEGCTPQPQALGQRHSHPHAHLLSPFIHLSTSSPPPIPPSVRPSTRVHPLPPAGRCSRPPL